MYFSEAANEEKPQDLSGRPPSSSGKPSMTSGFAQDHDYNSDLKDLMSPNLNLGLPTNRPQIIVSPRKSAAGEGGNANLTTPAISEPAQDFVSTSSGSTFANALSGSSSGWSVIVHAGSSLVSFNIFQKSPRVGRSLSGLPEDCVQILDDYVI